MEKILSKMKFWAHNLGLGKAALNFRRVRG